MADQVAVIDRAREAVGREAWAEAYRELSSLDPSSLGAEDSEGLADAAWWLSHLDESITARQRAYSVYAAEGRDPQAASVAVRLCFQHFDRGEPAVGMGWLMHAERHLRDQPECVQHGFLALCRGAVTHEGGDLDGARALAEEATRIGQRFGDREVIALGIHAQGRVLISAGRVTEGVALLDEAMTSVVAGELGQFYTGVIYCSVLEACLDLADVGRASEWSEAAQVWCRSLPPESPYPGLCRINRAVVSTFRGAWPEAEAEARRASEELSFNPMAAARAFYETGEIRRRIGNFAGAEEAFARAHEIGFEPQPGLALLRLSQGKTEAARTALRLSVAGESGNRLRRARLLAAYVEVALAASELDEARTASLELETIARDFQTPALQATAATARGSVMLAEGDLAGALENLRHACAVWQELRLPYEAARARILYGAAVRAAGDEDGARLELQAALASFERLGAATDAHRAAELLAAGTDMPRGLTAREVEVLRLVATGRTNRDVAAELVISEHTVARHLQNIFAKVGVSSRAAATAFAFEHGLA
ncbi:MAG: LuxR C-terminal-related transcriptional regulator [Actinomycetota bacterium]|nr:LuxR C-terminal-related transcriptional regulator [Actinomycetota bacterium]